MTARKPNTEAHVLRNGRVVALIAVAEDEEAAIIFENLCYEFLELIVQVDLDLEIRSDDDG